MDKRLPGRSGEKQPRTSTKRSAFPANAWVLLYIHRKCVILNPNSVPIKSGRFCFQGLGLVISGTMPVFNLTADPGSSQVKAPFRVCVSARFFFEGLSSISRSLGQQLPLEAGVGNSMCSVSASLKRIFAANVLIWIIQIKDNIESFAEPAHSGCHGG